MQYTAGGGAKVWCRGVGKLRVAYALDGPTGVAPCLAGVRWGAYLDHELAANLAVAASTRKTMSALTDKIYLVFVTSSPY